MGKHRKMVKVKEFKIFTVDDIRALEIRVKNVNSYLNNNEASIRLMSKFEIIKNTKKCCDCNYQKSLVKVNKKQSHYRWVWKDSV